MLIKIPGKGPITDYPSGGMFVSVPGGEPVEVATHGGPSGPALMDEDGNYILNEDGSYILLEG